MSRLSQNQNEAETFVDQVLAEFLRRIKEDSTIHESIHVGIECLIEADELSNPEKLLSVVGTVEGKETETHQA